MGKDPRPGTVEANSQSIAKRYEGTHVCAHLVTGIILSGTLTDVEGYEAFIRNEGYDGRILESYVNLNHVVSIAKQR